MLTGKGIYIWQIKMADGGDVNAIANLASQANLTHVIVKVLQSKTKYNLRWAGVRWVDDLLPALIAALHGQGVECWGYQYILLDDPVGEARAALARVNELGLDGLVVDAEKECKGKHAQARRYATELLDCPVETALSSYRYLSYHPTFPARELMVGLDYAMPQVYWEGAHNPAEQLAKTITEWDDFGKPIIPTGAAYHEHGWQAAAYEIQAFLNAAVTLGLPGCNFWRWGHARELGLWDVIRDYEWPGEPPEQDLEQRIASLEERVTKLESQRGGD